MEDKQLTPRQLKQLFGLFNEASDNAGQAWELRHDLQFQKKYTRAMKDMAQEVNAILFPDWQLTPRDSKQDLINSMSDVHNGD